MRVKELLGRKPDKTISVSPETTVADAATVMAKNQVGLLVVVDGDSNVVGVFSERDVVRAVAVGDGNQDACAIGKLMTSKVITCAESDGVLDAVRAMYGSHIRHLIVMDGDNLAGVLSLRDVLDAMFVRVEELEKAAA
jgi:CBS domain-containing protein